ncbi:specifically androgen-regulated gene protein [Anableps anableps]
MSKSGTWPGNVAMESLSNMDSAGSCDSVISTNSVWSEDSMEHLTAEEKACLMYLEETIEALEVQEDSGLSNDEPDMWSKTEPQDQIRSDVLIEMLKSGSHKISTPTPHTAADIPSAGLTTEHETEHHAANQNSKPQSVSSSVVGMKDVKTEDLGVVTDLSVSDSGYTTSSSEKTTEGSKLNGNTDPETVTNTADASENDLDIIPPPTDFRDELDLDFPPETMTVVPPPSNDFTKQKLAVDLEQMRLRASVKKSFVSSSAEDSPSKPSEVASLVPQMSPPSEFSEPRSPPAVAPKPKKLPVNIILKSQKTPTSVSHGNPGHLVPTHSDRMLLDPQKVRIEALKKLGLLKDNKEESSPPVSPKLPLKSPAYRGSQASHSPPVSPAAPHTPPLTPSLTPVNSPLPAIVLQQSVSPPVVLPSAASASPPNQDADILPAPAAFSDGIGPSGIECSAVTEATFSTPPALLKQLTPPKVIGMKSATLERSGLGLSSQMSNQNLLDIVGGEQDPKHLRNTRPRPASLGSGKDFSHAKGEGLVASRSPDSKKPLPTQAFYHRESAKLPRSQGISVLICPRPENEEDRREALKKLGLLRD